MYITYHIIKLLASSIELKFEVYAKIKKPIDEVFDAIYNPKRLSGYFTTGGASGPLDEGKEVRWDFHDFPAGISSSGQTINQEQENCSRMG
jgi:uncharacterized protein YndB with AHSA1/START domain